MLDHAEFLLSRWGILLAGLALGAALAFGLAPRAVAVAKGVLRIGNLYLPAEPAAELVVRISSRPFLEALAKSEPKLAAAGVENLVMAATVVAEPGLVLLEGHAPARAEAELLVASAAARIRQDHAAQLEQSEKLARTRLAEITMLKGALEKLLSTAEDEPLVRLKPKPDTLVERMNSLERERVEISLRALSAGTTLLDPPTSAFVSSAGKTAQLGAAAGLAAGSLLAYLLHGLRRRRGLAAPARVLAASPANDAPPAPRSVA